MKIKFFILFNLLTSSLLSNESLITQNECTTTDIISYESTCTTKPDNLQDIIYGLADRLYCQSETGDGGDDNEIYDKITEEYATRIKACLTQKDVLVNQFVNGVTPLMKAASYHQWEIIELLIQAGADLYLKDEDGRTALDFAVERHKLNAPGACGDIFQYVVSIVMMPYYTKERYNKCIDLLTKNILKRLYLRQYIERYSVKEYSPRERMFRQFRGQLMDIEEKTIFPLTPKLRDAFYKLKDELSRNNELSRNFIDKDAVQAKIDNIKKMIDNSEPLRQLCTRIRIYCLTAKLQKDLELLEDELEKNGTIQNQEERVKQFEIEFENNQAFIKSKYNLQAEILGFSYNENGYDENFNKRQDLVNIQQQALDDLREDNLEAAREKL